MKVQKIGRWGEVRVLGAQGKISPELRSASRHRVNAARKPSHNPSNTAKDRIRTFFCPFSMFYFPTIPRSMRQENKPISSNINT